MKIIIEQINKRYETYGISLFAPFSGFKKFKQDFCMEEIIFDEQLDSSIRSI